MKILFIHRDLPPDSYTGVSLQVHRLANILTRMKHTVTVLTFSRKPQDALYQVNTINIPGFLKKTESSPFKLLQRIILPWFFRVSNQSEYDIIHIHGDGGFFNYRKNCLRTFYGTARFELKHSKSLKGFLAQLISYLFEKIENEKIRRQGCAVGISSHSSRYLDSISRIIPCMLPDSGQDKPELKKSPYPTIYYMGSVGSRKRGELALALYLELKVLFPELIFHYISKTPVKDIAKFNILNTTVLKPPVFHENLNENEMKNIANESWIYLSLSSYEGFGVGIIEAMSSHCVVVSSENPGSRETINSQVNGIISTDQNLTGWVYRLITNKSVRQQLADNGSRQSSHYLPETIATAYVDIYKELA